jgi:hypothetical protein
MSNTTKNIYGKGAIMFTDVESQLESIEAIFAEATEDGLKLEEPHLFSFYFVDAEIEKLGKLGEQLEEHGYDYIGVFELEDEETDKPTGEYMLHVDKVETHTAHSLAERNVELARIAQEAGVTAYDGWEVAELEGEEDDENAEE